MAFTDTEVTGVVGTEPADEEEDKVQRVEDSKDLNETRKSG